MNVSDLGEFGLIDRLAKAVSTTPPEALIVGIGDDAAAWRQGDSVVLATTDTLVAGVHFLPDLAPWEDIGWKALAVNVSDVAAMGGTPQFALVTLALPVETSVDDVDALYGGLRECAEEYGVAIVGGDVVRAEEAVITVAVLGQAEVDEKGRPRLLLRDAAVAGDVIAVTGTLGDSAAGLRRLREGAPPGDALVRAHLRPRPPLATGRQAARLGARCAIDLSDGLLQDLGHVCRMSGLGATLHAEAVPTSEELRRAFGEEEALSLACCGGEDYQLALVASRQTIERLLAASDEPITIIGEMEESAVGEKCRPRLMDSSGEEVLPASVGWDHLRPSGRQSGRL